MPARVPPAPGTARLSGHRDRGRRWSQHVVQVGHGHCDGAAASLRVASHGDSESESDLPGRPRALDVRGHRDSHGASASGSGPSRIARPATARPGPGVTVTGMPLSDEPESHRDRLVTVTGTESPADRHWHAAVTIDESDRDWPGPGTGESRSDSRVTSH